MNTLRTSRTLLAAVALASLAGPSALAAPNGSDLTVQISAPTAQVGSSTRIDVSVPNSGRRNSTTATLTISLPTTATSPTVRVLGPVSGLSNGCSLARTTITCNLGTVSRTVPSQAGFDIMLPYSTTPIVFSASVAASNDTNPANNSGSATAGQTYQTVTVNTPANATASHCTGTALRSYADCLAAPGSVSSFPMILAAGGIVDLSPAGPDSAGYAGTWAVNGTDFTLQLTANGQPAGTMQGKGVSANCWEGPMDFGSSYMAMYRVCI